MVPEEVVAEITNPAQRQQLDVAISNGSLRVETITDFDDLVEYAELRRALGRGEAACIVLARSHGWLVASDERGRFQRTVNTAGLFVAAIRAGLVSIEDADQAKSILEQHRFLLPFESFGAILGQP